MDSERTQLLLAERTERVIDRDYRDYLRSMHLELAA